jgi:hypothetical protein
MEEVLACLSQEAEEFLEDREEEGAVEIREDEVVMAWYDEFDRLIYNQLQPNDRVEVGIMLVDENPTGSKDFLHQQLNYVHLEAASSTWSFCYETANEYDRDRLETYRAGQLS